MKRRNFINKLFQVTAVAMLAVTPLMVIPSIKKDFVKIEFGEIRWNNWSETDSKGWKVGSFNISITGEGDQFEAMVKLLN